MAKKMNYNEDKEMNMGMERCYNFQQRGRRDGYCSPVWHAHVWHGNGKLTDMYEDLFMQVLHDMNAKSVMAKENPVIEINPLAEGENTLARQAQYQIETLNDSACFDKTLDFIANAKDLSEDFATAMAAIVVSRYNEFDWHVSYPSEVEIIINIHIIQKLKESSYQGGDYINWLLELINSVIVRSKHVQLITMRVEYDARHKCQRDIKKLIELAQFYKKNDKDLEEYLALLPKEIIF